MVSDDEAERVAGLRFRDSEAQRWVARLLEDRRERTAIIQRLARRLHHLRRRLQQASAYFDALVGKAHQITRQPWPRQLLCPHCGAPVARVRMDQGPGGVGHVQVHDHPDGTRCEEPPER